jgi:hypothetical protein
LTGAALRHAIEEKFDIDLSGHPTLLTVRGKSDGKDGRIHTDSESKIITLLLYLNPVWDLAEGRLRLLRGPTDIEDYVREVAPLAGTMLAFRRSGRSFHGHQPHVGERRVLQLNWVTEWAVVRRELNRHRWSARLKALNPFRSHRGRPSPAKEGGRADASLGDCCRQSCRHGLTVTGPTMAVAQTQIVDGSNSVSSPMISRFCSHVETGPTSISKCCSLRGFLGIIGSPRPISAGPSTLRATPTPAISV